MGYGESRGGSVCWGQLSEAGRGTFCLSCVLEPSSQRRCWISVHRLHSQPVSLLAKTKTRGRQLCDGGRGNSTQAVRLGRSSEARLRQVPTAGRHPALPCDLSGSAGSLGLESTSELWGPSAKQACCCFYPSPEHMETIAVCDGSSCTERIHISITPTARTGSVILNQAQHLLLLAPPFVGF